MLILWLWGSTAGLMGQSVEKTFVRSFNLQGISDVTLHLQGPVEVKTWSEDILRVQMNVQLYRGSEAMLRSLVQAGRYNLRGNAMDGVFNVQAPGLAREVRFNGQLLVEQISFTVFAPEQVQISIEDGTAAAAFLPPSL
jgi:hypothetical protein